MIAAGTPEQNAADLLEFFDRNPAPRHNQVVLLSAALSAAESRGLERGAREAHAVVATLYDVLRTTRHNLVTLRSAHPGVRTYGPWLEIVEAALAKAEGRSAPEAP